MNGCEVTCGGPLKEGPYPVRKCPSVNQKFQAKVGVAKEKPAGPFQRHHHLGHLFPRFARHAGQLGHRGGEPTETQLVDVSQNLWSTFGNLAKKEAPQISGLRSFSVPTMSGAERQSRTDTRSPPPVFEFDALCINQFHHEPHSMIGSLVVLTCMVRPVKGVGQTS